ncbi:hypothetical protein BD626DRAFT_576872 [Schizophyllum amplum]|uniref:Uncharacterized protein n=1 Tax=Schizophyllum amplum TaxID=97359 RepID=A0A550BT02_9AGAR|nr:hypothetical protein BD626DRAFT_576872 [Auriculariopsis ampla]
MAESNELRMAELNELQSAEEDTPTRILRRYDFTNLIGRYAKARCPWGQIGEMSVGTDRRDFLAVRVAIQAEPRVLEAIQTEPRLLEAIQAEPRVLEAIQSPRPRAMIPFSSMLRAPARLGPPCNELPWPPMLRVRTSDRPLRWHGRLTATLVRGRPIWTFARVTELDAGTGDRARRWYESPRSTLVRETEFDTAHFELDPVQFELDAAPFELDTAPFEADAARFEHDAARFELDGAQFEHDDVCFELDDVCFELHTVRFELDDARSEPDNAGFELDGAMISDVLMNGRRRPDEQSTPT